MIPLRDTIRSRTAPVVTVGLIVLNVLIYLHEVALGPLLPRFVHAYGLVPYRFVFWTELGGDPLDAARFLPLLTSMFWHGGFLHLAGNMLYLWIFGDNIEDRLGHVRFFFFYLISGVCAALVQVYFDPRATLPTVGASGAIAGVLGAYLVTFPRSRILAFVPIFFLPWLVEIPAVIYLAFWFLLQLGSAVLDSASPSHAHMGGIAFWAHTGGFVAGILLVKLMQPPAARAQRRDLQ
ncbi:MAG TPA: rhomboid family intramembrane serine protease [Myxococcales bacterium]|nr:rhomboid family intramembrane serine protease [Myxococcales bacterium]